MSPSTRRKWSVVAAAVLSAACVSCGPFFPDQVLDRSDRDLLSAPVADFDVEVDRLASKPISNFRAVLPSHGFDPFQQSAEVDGSELQTALARQGLPDQTRSKICEEYGLTRQAIARYAADQNPNHAPLIAPKIPGGLPSEFSDYLTGLIAYYQRRMPEARTAWESLLARPIEQRKNRSTWAAFMMGKSYLNDDPAQAALWFQRVRDLTQRGFADRLGLAAASYGWEGRAELKQGHFGSAIRLYQLVAASGDPDPISLRDTAAAAIIAGPEVLAQLAADDAARPVVTAYTIARGGSLHPPPTDAAVRAWLAATEAAGIRNLAGSDRLAWAAYQIGDFAMAGRWLDRAPADSAIACWIRAKLLMRAGKIDQAATSLARAVQAFPHNEEWTYDGEPSEVTPFFPAGRAAGELGLLKMARGQYINALDLLLRNGWWTDAAYIAERVLTVDELKRYVDRAWPNDPLAAAPVQQEQRGEEIQPSEPNPSWAARQIRWLLARRLTRLGRWKEARAYFPPELQPRLDSYISAIRAGYDSTRPQEQRAASLWIAAKIAREEGMDLLATELSPDYRIWDCQFSEPGPEPARAGGAAGRAQIAPPTQDERRRLASSAPAEPNRRFHYRYIAADHAWAAAQLMPDQSDRTASVLCEAGGWLKERDPASADRFYKDLVSRCGNTELGREAQRLHWFPKTPDATRVDTPAAAP